MARIVGTVVKESFYRIRTEEVDIVIPENEYHDFVEKYKAAYESGDWATALGLIDKYADNETWK